MNKFHNIFIGNDLISDIFLSLLPILSRSENQIETTYNCQFSWILYADGVTLRKIETTDNWQFSWILFKGLT